jgi:hypothetical protein
MFAFFQNESDSETKYEHELHLKNIEIQTLLYQLHEQKESDRNSLLEQLRSEQEEKQKQETEKTLKKELYDYFKNETNSHGPNNFKKSIETSVHNNDYMRELKQIYEYIKSELILFVHGENFKNYEGDHYFTIVTNKNVYRIFGNNRNDRIHLSPMYSFSCELDVKALTILKYIKNNCMSLFNPSQGLIETNKQNTFYNSLRLIPGSFKCGSWKELNGLFGGYYNEETHEIRVSPPYL